MKLKKMLLVIMIPLLLEICVFNFMYMINKFDKTLDKDIVYDIEDFDKTNWEIENNVLISNIDPILELYKIDTEVKNIDIMISGVGNLPYIDIFYTKIQNESFSGDNLDRITTNISGNLNKKVNIKLNKFISKLRLDLADEKGLELKDITIIINPSKLRINYARLIAMWLIYLTSKFLFSLQKNPKYD